MQYRMVTLTPFLVAVIRRIKFRYGSQEFLPQLDQNCFCSTIDILIPPLPIAVFKMIFTHSLSSIDKVLLLTRSLSLKY